MFDRVSCNSFENRQHVGEFTEISFDIAVDDEGSQIETIGASLHYLKFGHGEPLILVHGLGQSMFTWRKCFWMLEDKYTVYALDLPGHGFSEKASMTYAVEDYSLSIESFMISLGIERAHIAAFGEAVTYVLDFAEQAPEKIMSLILVSPQLERNDMKGHCFMPFVGVSSKFMFSKKSFVSEVGSWFFDKTDVSDFVLDEYYLPFDDKAFRQILKISGENYNDIEVKENIAKVKAPMLIVRGMDDRLSPDMQEGLGGLPMLRAKAFAVRNSGWLVQEEKPDRLCAAIDQFIELVRQK